LPSNNYFIINLVKIWPGGAPSSCGGRNFEDKLRSTYYTPSGKKKLHPKWKE